MMSEVDLSEEFNILGKIIWRCKFNWRLQQKNKRPNLSKGELLSAKLLTAFTDKWNSMLVYRYRELIKTDSKFGEAQPLEQISKKKCNRLFQAK
jgi:aspartokinase/homoserine dehydrogenase 1